MPLVFGLLLGRAVVLGVMKPFGVGYVVALAALGQHARALAATVGAVVGGALAPSLEEGVEPWLALFVVWCVTLGAGRWFRLPPAVVAVGALTGVASLRIVTAAFTGDDLFLAAAATGVELTSLMVFFPFVRLWTDRPAELSRPQLAALLAVLGLLVLGTENVSLYGLSVMDVFMRVLLLLAAWAGAMGVGSAAGAAVGLLSVLSAGGMTWASALLAPAGLLAGLGGQFGRPGALAGLLTAHLLLSPYAANGEQIARALAHSLIAAGLVALIPQSALRALFEALPETTAWRVKVTRTERDTAAATRTLRRIASVLDDVGRTLGGTWEKARGDETFDRFVADVSEHVCVGCSHYDVCWETHVYRTYRDLVALAAAASSDRVRAAQLPEGLRQRCVQPEHLAAGINRRLADWRAGASLPAPGNSGADDVAVDQVYREAARTYAGVAAVVGAAADEVAKGPAGKDDGLSAAGRQPDRKARFRLVVDVAQAAAGPVSGDCFRRVDLSGHRVALIISDGMGTGLKAAVESEAAAAMLARFLMEGFDPRFAVRTINAVLTLRGTDDSFATLDVCLFDLTDGTVQMLKTGAVPTYVRRGEHVDVVRADSLPVGIVHGVEAAAVVYRLAPGDLVVMMTDGALEAETIGDDKAATAARALKRLETPEPHAAVDELFRRVRPDAGKRVTDDVTIVAARLLPA